MYNFILSVLEMLKLLL